MTMFRKLLVPALVLAIAIPVMAQDTQKGKRPERKSPAKKPAQQRTLLPAKMLAGLDLTDEQKEKIEAITKDVHKAMTEARAAMEKLLTEEQKKARMEAMKAAKEAGKKPEEARKAVQDAVQLTDEQKKLMAHAREQMGQMHKDVREKIMAILTPEQKKELAAKMKALAAERRKATGQKKPAGDKKAPPAKKKAE